MELLHTFSLAALVFLALPLPLFASAALGACPVARRSLLPWVWGNALGGAVAGLAIVATPLPPWIALSAGAVIFLVCGAQMFHRLARTAATSAHAS